MMCVLDLFGSSPWLCGIIDLVLALHANHQLVKSYYLLTFEMDGICHSGESKLL